MGVPHITSFCWCMGLEVGAKCVGFMHLVSEIFTFCVCGKFCVLITSDNYEKNGNELRIQMSPPVCSEGVLRGH